jgi:hypothetical protein
MKYLIYIIIPFGGTEWKPIKSVKRSEDGEFLYDLATSADCMSYNDATSFLNDLKAQFPEQTFEMQEVEEPYYGS